MKRTALNLPNAGEVVAKPEGWDLVMWFDLSPMRPDDHANTQARRWLETTTLRAAGERGRQEATDEGEVDKKLAARRDALVKMDMQA